MNRPSQAPTVDPAMIAAVAREVIQRLKAQTDDGSPESTAKSSAGESLVTLQTLQQHTGAKEILVSSRAVITPAAREEAASQGIRLRTSDNNAVVSAVQDVSTANKPLQHQLERRGVKIPDGIEVIWTDRPASEVYRQCRSGKVTAMISCIADVDRFANELSPTHWVLDAQKLNLIAAANTAAKIAQVTSAGNEP